MTQQRDGAGKVALVTGGSAGIGLRAAERFAREGMRVVIAARREGIGRAVTDAIVADGGDAAFFRTDVAVSIDVQRLVTHITDRYGRLDYAFNNAGVNLPGTVMDTTEEDFDATFAVNVRGLWLCMREELRIMRRQGSGAIVNNLSVHSMRSVFHGVASYAASKHAGVALTRTAAFENAAAGVRVNAVAPGPIATEMLVRSGVSAPGVREWQSMIPAGRIGEADDVVDAVLWLLSDASAYVAGQVLAVDGGFLAL